MVITTYTILAIIGLLSIITGTLMVSMKRKIRRRYTYPLLLLGGICLEIYSIYIGDTIFIILQAAFIISTIYGIVKVNERYLQNFLKVKI
ncbi:MAG: hypothetical protein NUV97_04435 [archaeon]|nr:hypothetical protein [archaeon]MCR4323378.1 hypothetical protein [Nanoarchaeota archaeon]